MERVGLTAEDAVLEIGPGLGALTRPAARIARSVRALEVDRGLVALLREQGLPANVDLREVDVRRVDLHAAGRELGPPVVLLGSLPYVIAGRLVAELCRPGLPFRRMGLMIQTEVADRLLAEPGTPAYGTLSVWVRLWTEAHRVMDLGPGEFEPRPKVHSSFLLFERRGEPPEVDDPALLREVVRGAFGQRRKTLRGALRRSLPRIEAALAAAGIDPVRRGETLSEDEFVVLANALHRQASRHGEDPV